MTQAVQLPDEMKLVLTSNQVELEDAKRLADLKVQNDDVIALCYRKQSTEGTKRAVCVRQAAPLHFERLLPCVTLELRPKHDCGCHCLRL